jgi:hypothetical protein
MERKRFVFLREGMGVTEPPVWGCELRETEDFVVVIDEDGAEVFKCRKPCSLLDLPQP